MQGVADQQRGRFVVFDVHGRPAAAEHVVVHAGKIVVHERVRMHQLHGARRDFQPLGHRAGDFAGRKAKERPHALAATEHGVAHRLVQARGRDMDAGKQARQRALHARLHFTHPGLEGRVSHYCRGR